MKNRRIWALGTIAIAEAIVIVVLLYHPRRIVVTVRHVAVTVDNPFELAFFYEASDSKFEQLAKQFPERLSARDPFSDFTPLGECNAYRRTNVARILIANGANVQAAIEDAKRAHDDDGLKFLTDILAEHRADRN